MFSSFTNAFGNKVLLAGILCAAGVSAQDAFSDTNSPPVGSSQEDWDHFMKIKHIVYPLNDG